MKGRDLPSFFLSPGPGKPEGPFCLSCTFIFRNERNWMKKSARVSEKLVSPGLPSLQVATRLKSKVDLYPHLIDSTWLPVQPAHTTLIKSLRPS